MRDAQHFQQALAFHLQGDLASAQRLCEEILVAHPEQFDVLSLLAVIAAQTGNAMQAAELIGRAVAVDPDHALAFFYRASVLHASRQWDGALAGYSRAIDLDPVFADAYLKRGNVHCAVEQWDAALADYDRTLAIKPDAAEAHFNRAVLLDRFGQLEAAVESYGRAIDINADYPEAHYNRGNLLCRLRQWEAALVSYDRAIASRDGYAEAYANRAVVQSELQQVDAAIASCDAAIAIKDDYAEAHSNRGLLLQEVKQWDAALASCNRAIALKRHYAEPYFNRSIVRLLHGDFANGWVDYEFRSKHQDGTESPDSASSRAQAFRQTRWQGAEPLAGKTILVYGEQGLGDTLQFCRYVRLLADLGAKVILDVQPALAGLLSRLQGVSRLHAAGDPFPDFDYHCPLLSLPLAFKTELSTIPPAPAYLSADAGDVSRWRARLGKKSNIRIGLMWSGNAGNKRDRYRSIPLSTLLRHLPEGFQYVSLQKEVREIDAETLRSNPQIMNLADEQKHFDDAAALCGCMDLVISVDTSVAHLSGALGRETWILLSSTPDWRWLLNRTDSPWYPTATLYRQKPIEAEWGPVLERLSADLRLRFPCSMQTIASTHE